jgi:hypothetical protein
VDFDIIKGLLNSRLRPNEKLKKIEEIVERAGAIETMAVEYASQEGRKPTSDDRLKAIKQFAERKNIKLGGINKEQLALCFNESIQWLKKTIQQNGVWETNGDVGPYIVEEKPLENIRPLSMLFVAPWEISMTILTLGDWIKYFSPKDNEALDLIEKGKAFLRKNQLFLSNGALGDSLWIRRMHFRDVKAAGNTLETSMAIFALGLPYGRSSFDYASSIREGVNYLINNWNKKDGGWGFKKGWKSDIKSTAISLMTIRTSIIRNQLPEEEFSEEKLKLCTRGGLEWILKNQNEDGSWRYDSTSRDSAVFGSFYAIEALALEKCFLKAWKNQKGLENLGVLEKRIDFALWKALRWYEQSQKFIKAGDKEGWGWENHLEHSDVENTAASLTILLDTGWMSETSASVERTLDWLIKKKHSDNFWHVNTPLVLKGLIKVLKPEARLYNYIQELVSSK